MYGPPALSDALRFSRGRGTDVSRRFAGGSCWLLLLMGLMMLDGLWGSSAHAAASSTRAVRHDPVLAAPHGAVTEVVQRRTESSTTWATSDGGRVTRAGLEPVRYRDGHGVLRSFDFTLRRQGERLAPSGWRVGTRPVAIELPWTMAPGDAGAWVLTAGADQIAVSLAGATSTAKVGGTQAIYPDAVPGVAVTLGPTPQGLKETLSLSSLSATSDYAYAIKLSEGLTASRDARSGAIVVSRSDRTVFTLPAPVVTDAAGRLAPRPAYTLRELSNGRASLSFSVDRGWLARPERKWPVVVDPTTNVVSSTAAATRMCPIGNLDVTTVCNDPNMAATGYLVSGTNFGQERVALRFAPLTYLADDDYIDSAHLKLYQVSNAITGATTDQGIIASAIGNDWTTSSEAPKSTYPFFGTVTGQLNPEMSSFGTAAPRAGAAWLDVNLTDVVGYWQTYRTQPSQGIPDYGVQLSRAATAAGARIDTRIAPYGTANAPYLEIKSIVSAPAAAEVRSPEEGLTTARRVSLVAHSPNASVTSMTFQYVAGSQRYWTDIPATALRFRDGTAVTSTNIPVSAASGGGVDNKALVWDIQATTGGNIDGSVHVRAVLTGPAGTNGATEPVNFKLDRRDPQKQATAPIGPGQVNLLTGDFTMSSTDVDMAAYNGDLSVQRTYHSRNVSTRDAEMFGPNWAASFAADGGALPYRYLYNHSEVKEKQVTRWVKQPSTYNFEADFDAGDEAAGTDPAAFANTLGEWTPVTDTVRWTYGYVEIELADGARIVFEQTTDENGVMTGWEPDDVHPGMKLAGSAGNPWVLTEARGATATFVQDTANSPNYHVTTFTNPGTSSMPTMDYQSVAGRLRLTRVTAAKFSTNMEENRYLQFVWAQDGSTGNQPRVKTINRGFYDGTSIVEEPVASYVYDTQGRLVSAINPRLSGAGTTTYTYDSGGHVGTITPPGQVPWRLGYTSGAGDDNTGRLASVKRVHPTLGSDATQWVQYGVPLTGANAPTQMDATRLATWDQTDDLPTDATSISIPAHIPTSSSDFVSSTVYYMDVNGREVNRLRAIGETASLSTTQYDDNGNIVMELTGANRSKALAATTVPTQQAAQALETVHHYAANGVDELWTLGPTHKMTVPGVGEVFGRTRTVTSYDANSPNNAEYHLPTSVAVSAQYDNSSGTHLADTRTTTYRYDGEDSSGFANRGWALRKPTSVTVDPGGGDPVMKTWTVYHTSAPVAVQVFSPAATNWGSPNRTTYIYYGINSFYHYEWMGLMRAKSIGVVSPQAPMPMTEAQYDDDFNMTGRYDTLSAGFGPSQTLRYEGLNYDNAGRPEGRVAYTTESGTITSQVSESRTYDAQGNAVTVSTGPTSTLTSTFDNNGRLTSYTDSKGSITSYTYNINGDVATRVDPHGTRSYVYNSRFLPTSVNDSQFGVMTGTWDQDDQLTGQAVLGMTSTTTWDEAGEQVDRIHYKNSCSCKWAEDHVKYDAGGRVVAETTGTGKRSQTFAYDGAGRLKEVQDKAAVNAADCFTRVYGYDVDSNRTSLKSYPAASAGTCAKTTTPTVTSSTYDSADRLTVAGSGSVGYDGLQRIKGLFSSTPTISYNVDDQMTSVLQGSVWETFTPDPLSRTATSEPGQITPNPTTYHYGDGGAAASWKETGTVWTRYLDGLDGETAARKSSSDAAPTMMLANLRGDIVTEGVSTGSAPTWTGAYDEFGVQLAGGPAREYGWFGGVGLLTGGDPGIVQMGARTYLPTIGRFLQTDPVQGGSANTYDYVNQDPMNQRDLNGLEPGSAQSMAEARAYYKKYYKCVELWANNGVAYTKCFRHRQGFKGCLKEMADTPDSGDLEDAGGWLKLVTSLAPLAIIQEYACWRGARRLK